VTALTDQLTDAVIANQKQISKSLLESSAAMESTVQPGPFNALY
jgi:hypothetical protein